jgi:N,N'-diacetyllegionaminate synthase
LTRFDHTFEISGRPVGGDAPVLFIAEAGVAHFGDPEKADALVDMAAAAGADVFKTQAFQTDRLVSARAPEWRDRLRPKEVGFFFLERMKDRCEKRNLIFMCSAHNEGALDWVRELDVPAFKIGSGERGNLPYLAATARLGKPLILSTGMYREADVSEALTAISNAGCRHLALLHCVTSYPTPRDQVNLRAMEALKAIFPGPVGWSDHTEGGHVLLAAVAMGAKIVEKHITLDFDVPNAQDWKVSAGPDDLRGLIQSVRDVEAALGKPVLEVQDCEAPALEWALKSLVAARDLEEGTALSREMIEIKRPGGGLPPTEFDTIVGRTLRRRIRAEHFIELDDLA